MNDIYCTADVFGEPCRQKAGDLNHLPEEHKGACLNADGTQGQFCYLHEFKASEAQHIIDARILREAAVKVADLAPPLAEALHLKSQDVFEAGEAALNEEAPGLYAVATANSVYLIRFEANGQKWVLSRTSLRDDGWLPTNLAYSGWVLSRGIIRVGRRFSFEWSQQPSKGPINVSQVTSITRLT